MVVIIPAFYTKTQLKVTSVFLPHQGHFEPFKRYDIYVYPVYTLHPQKYAQAGRPVTTAAYIQQGCMYRTSRHEVTFHFRRSC